MIRQQRPNVNSSCNNVRTIRSTTTFGLIPTTMIMIMSLLMLLSTINAFMVTSPTVTTTKKRLPVSPITSPSSLPFPSQLSNTNMMLKLNDNTENDDAGNVIDVVKQDKNQKKSTQPTPILLQHALQGDSSSKKLGVSMMTAIMIFLTSLSITTSVLPLPADAAMSGGRMGGSFSSRSSSGGGGSSMRMAPSRGGSYYGGSSRSSYYGPRSSTIIAPIISPFATTPFITPFYNPIVPFYGGGVGAISYNRGPGLFDLLFLGGLGWFVVSAISNTINTRTMSQWDDYDNTGSNNNLFGGLTSNVVEPTTVVKCSVALDVSNRDDPNSILSVLDRMAKVTSKTDTRKGVQTLTKQVALELLRRKSSIYSASGTIQQYKNHNDAQRIYNQYSIVERSKFEQENINKFGKFDLSIIKNKDINNDTTTAVSKATMAVVTIILSVQGSQSLNNITNNKMKKIQSRSDLESILQSIASLDANTDELYGAEILWTPEDRSETLTKKDIIADYPELTTL